MSDICVSYLNTGSSGPVLTFAKDGAQLVFMLDSRQKLPARSRKLSKQDIGELIKFLQEHKHD